MSDKIEERNEQSLQPVFDTAIFKTGVSRTTQEVDERGNVLNNLHQWASGGIGYFLSRRALCHVAEMEPSHWAEDLWVGQVLGDLAETQGFRIGSFMEQDGVSTWHFCATGRRMTYDPSWQLTMYRERT